MVTKNRLNIATGASGTALLGAGVGIAPTFSTATYPSTAGASGNVLTSDGTNWNSSAAPTGGGCIVFISTTTVSGASQAAFTSGIDSTYSTYLFMWQEVSAATDNVTFGAQISTDGGSSWTATGYTGNFAGFGTSGTTETSTTRILLSNVATGYSSSNSGGGHFWLRNVGTSTLSNTDGTMSYPRAGGIGFTGGMLGGRCPASITINAIRFLMSSGNISGTFTMYGVKQS